MTISESELNAIQALNAQHARWLAEQSETIERLCSALTRLIAAYNRLDWELPDPALDEAKAALAALHAANTEWTT